MMKSFAFKYLTLLSRKYGVWIFEYAALIIAAFYFFIFYRKTLVSVKFYKELFPNKGRFFHLNCAWKQYQNFTNIFLDRFIMEDYDDISYTSEGFEHLEKAVKNKTGGILLMSHMGNWEVAAHLLKRRGMRMLLYMGIKQKEQIEKAQKESLARSGLKIVAVSRDGGSPLDILEGINFMKDGGLVSLTGDRVWKGEQRTVDVNFMGHKVKLPETSHIIALLSGAPLFIFFVFRTGKKQYHFQICSPKYVKASSRSERKKSLKNSAQEYAGLMEDTLRRYPYEWFHFEQFLGKKLTNK